MVCNGRNDTINNYNGNICVDDITSKLLEIGLNIVNEIEKYKNKGYEIIPSNDHIEVIFNRHSYHITIVEENCKLYWRLEPYNGSYYATLLDDLPSSFHLVMFAIHDHDTLYKINPNNNLHV